MVNQPSGKYPGGFFVPKTKEENTLEDNRETIRVVYCEPGRLAQVKEIGTELEDLQRAVGGGLIETFYPFEDEMNAVVVCNDEGKFNGMRPCRAFYGEDGKMMDIVFGPFFICDCSGENFASLSDEKLQHFAEQFRYPEHYLRIDGELKAVRYDPTRGRDPAR